MTDTLADRKPASILALLAAVLPFYLLDQATKWWIVKNFFPLEERIVSPGFFSLVNWQNTGAAFSMGTGNNGFFIALSVAAFIGLVVFYRRGAFPDAASRWAVMLLLSGILGNLTDRIAHGHVVDFLLFDLHIRYAHPFPAFNVADSCITGAVILFILGSFAGQKKEPATGA